MQRNTQRRRWPQRLLFLFLAIACSAAIPAGAQERAFREAEQAVKDYDAAQAVKNSESAKLGKNVQAKEDALDRAIRERDSIETTKVNERNAADEKVKTARASADAEARNAGVDSSRYRDAQTKQREALKKIQGLYQAIVRGWSGGFGKSDPQTGALVRRVYQLYREQSTRPALRSRPLPSTSSPPLLPASWDWRYQTHDPGNGH